MCLNTVKNSGNESPNKRGLRLWTNNWSANEHLVDRLLEPETGRTVSALKCNNLFKGIDGVEDIIESRLSSEREADKRVGPFWRETHR